MQSNFLKNLYFFVTLAVLMTLGGCATNQPKDVEIVVQESMILVEPDPIYLEDCEVAPQVSPEVFVKMTKDQRTDYRVRQIIAQYRYTRQCTDDKRHLKAQVEKQRKEVEDYNAKMKENAEKRKAEILKGNP